MAFKTLHDGQHLILKEDDRTGSLILDIKTVDKLTGSQIRRIDKMMFAGGEDTWFGEPSQKFEVLALVRQIDMPWTSRAEEERAAQQRIGGR